MTYGEVCKKGETVLAEAGIEEAQLNAKIGRASCRERVFQRV